MKVLVLGADGRTHALVWKLFNSASADVLVAPGNGGAVQLAPQVDIDPNDPVEVARWAFSEQIDLIVPADSHILAAGLVDEVVAMQIGVFGPAKRSTRLEYSRGFAKRFLLRHKLPTARGNIFTDPGTAEKFLAAHPLPVVIKADHPQSDIAVYDDRLAAIEGLRGFFAEEIAPEGGVVIEAYLEGIPISCSAITDGIHTISLLPIRRYEHLSAANDSPPAPGMGALTSNSEFARRLGTYLHQRLILPLVEALAKDTLPYWGIIGIDGVITRDGPIITGIRCSLNDQEAQVVLPRMNDDLLVMMQASIARRLNQLPAPRWRDEASVGIGLVTQGYPHHFPIGGMIEGLSQVDPGVLIFHNQTHNPIGLRHTPTQRGTPFGTLFGIDDKSPAITLTGGHALTVVALGATLNGARGRALLNAERITFPGRIYRDDIGAHEFN
jgi:phosphoribosylamine--glycine ligase